MLTIGIIGGMGPLATADLFTKIIQATPAADDQEHIKIIVYNNPQIPSRIHAILQGAPSPLSELVRSARLLEQAGAGLIAMACNTAHYWYDDVQAATGVRMLHMIDHVAACLEEEKQGDEAGTAMLFATEATVRVGLYQRTFAGRGMELRLPEEREQQCIMAAIAGAKAGRIADNPELTRLGDMVRKYQRDGVTAIVGGCTEIPLLFPHIDGEFRRIDPTQLLAQELVRRALQ